MHGEVKINDYEIARWTAVRIPATNGYAIYNCTLEYEGKDGYHYTAGEFQVIGLGEPTDTGPITLTADILKTGALRLKRKLEAGIQ